MPSHTAKDSKKSTKNRILNHVPQFLQKIYEMLSRSEISDVICWADDGLSFIIKDESRFANEEISKYFKHSNFSSFIRQLNMYDFHKSKRKPS